jgi:hypothetical protein
MPSNVGFVSDVNLSRYPIVMGDDWYMQLQITEEVDCVTTPVDVSLATNLVGALAVNNSDSRIFVPAVTVQSGIDGMILVFFDKEITSTMFPSKFQLHLRMDLPPWGTKTWVLNSVPVVKGIIP